MYHYRLCRNPFISPPPLVLLIMNKFLVGGDNVNEKEEDKELFYFRENKECDIVVKKGLKIIKALQVCYELNEKNKKREINGLTKAMDKFKLKKGLILTFDQDKEINIAKKRIFIKPVWKWLLENNKK